MNSKDIIHLLREHRANFSHYQIKSLAIFGSVARNEANQNSDVDLLVEFNGPATFDGYMELKFYLEDLLDRPIDLVTMNALRPQMKPQVLKEAIAIA